MNQKPHFLVAAGSSWENIDDVRQWGNIFTGQTGLDIARALLDLGDVTLLTSNLRHADEYDGFSGSSGMLGIETYRSHADLRELLAERLASSRVDAVFMSAAVSDYAPAGVFKVARRLTGREAAAIPGVAPGQEVWFLDPAQAPKVKSYHGTIAVLGEATEKLIDLFRTRWGYRGLLVKFKLEAGIDEDQLRQIAAQSRTASGADFIVANTLEMVHGPDPGAYILGERLNRRVARSGLANALRDLIAAELKRSREA